MITPRSIVMVKPWDFSFNEESAISNAFQKNIEVDKDVNQLAIEEFDNAVDLIRQKEIEVIVFDNKGDINKVLNSRVEPWIHFPMQSFEELNQLMIKIPDAVFPNNWIGFHPNGRVILYPMMHENRRNERNTNLLDLVEENGHSIKEVIDLSHKEEFGEFLEGTGSMVIDYKSKIAYACASPRTDIPLFNETAGLLGLESFSFNASDLQGRAIYHTNVLLTITEKLAIVCLECIDNSIQRMMLKKKLELSGLEILEISFAQLENFCGNLFEVKNNNEESFIIGSSSAWLAFTKEQQDVISTYHSPILIDIPTIETIGGGSARCMVAGVYF